jgi:hypothetical protein
MQPGVPPHTQQTPFGGTQPQYAQPGPAQPQYGQPPQQMIIGQPTMAQPVVGMGHPMMGGMYPVTQATTALVMSILGLVCCGFFAIPGIIMANSALAITNANPGHPDAGSAKAAQVISWVVIGLTAAVVVIYLGMGVLMVASDGY